MNDVQLPDWYLHKVALLALQGLLPPLDPDSSEGRRIRVELINRSPGLGRVSLIEGHAGITVVSLADASMGIVGQDGRRAVDSLNGASLLFDPYSPEGRRRLIAGEYPGHNVVSLAAKRAQRKAISETCDAQQGEQQAAVEAG